MEYEAIKKSLERDYLIIKKGKWWSFLGGAVAFVVIAGFVSYQAGLSALKDPAVANATDKIETLLAEAKADREKIRQNLANSEEQLKQQLDAKGEVRVETGSEAIGRGELPQLGLGTHDNTSRGVLNGRVHFSEPFAFPPKVIMALSSMDVYSNSTRLVVEVTSVDRRGFNYKFYTWNVTEVMAARASWIAVAQ